MGRASYQIVLIKAVRQTTLYNYNIRQNNISYNTNYNNHDYNISYNYTNNNTTSPGTTSRQTVLYNPPKFL